MVENYGRKYNLLSDGILSGVVNMGLNALVFTKLLACDLVQAAGASCSVL